MRVSNSYPLAAPIGDLVFGYGITIGSGRDSPGWHMWYGRGKPVHLCRHFCVIRMRLVLALVLLALAACTESSVSRIDSRTFSIESAGIPGGSDAPNRRLAERVCPGGDRVVDQTVHRNTPDRARDEPGVFTNWTIRCL